MPPYSLGRVKLTIDFFRMPIITFQTDLNRTCHFSVDHIDIFHHRCCIDPGNFY